jgi:signal transduction histidine kinase
VSRIPASLAVDLNLHGLDAPLPGLLATAVYRIVQELLNNVMKHAQAQEVFVQVSHEDDQIYLSVEDDGVGFDTTLEASPVGVGLAGIRTRVGLLSGTFSINSRPGRGTAVFLQVPLPAA